MSDFNFSQKEPRLINWASGKHITKRNCHPLLHLVPARTFVIKILKISLLSFNLLSNLFSSVKNNFHHYIANCKKICQCFIKIIKQFT